MLRQDDDDEVDSNVFEVDSKSEGAFVFPKVHYIDKMSKQDRADEKILIEMVKLKTAAMQDTCHLDLIKSSMKQQTVTGMRKNILMLCVRLAHAIQERQGYEKTAAFAMYEKMEMQEDLQARAKAAATEKRNLRQLLRVRDAKILNLERKLFQESGRNRLLAFGYGQYFKLEHTGRIDLTEEDKLLLEASKRLYKSEYLDGDPYE